MRRWAAVGNHFRAKKRPSLARLSPYGQHGGVPSYRVDLHNHCLGDPLDHLTHTILEHIDESRRKGLDAIAMTWHRRVCTDEAAFAYARDRGFLLIPGMEAEVRGKHLVILGLRDGDLPGETTWEEVRALRARKPEVVVMAPHPYYPHPVCLNQYLNEGADCIDVVEWCALHVNWLPQRINPNLRAARWAQRHGKPLVACSDAHSPAAIGRNPSQVEAPELSERAILAAVRAGHVTFPRHSLSAGVFLRRTVGVAAAQPRNFGRMLWRKRKGMGTS